MSHEKLITIPGDPKVTVHLRRSNRARRLSLRVSHVDGRVTLTMPERAHMSEGVAFVEDRQDWIRGHVQACPSVLRPALDASIPFRGAQLMLTAAQGRQVKLSEGQLQVPGDAATLPRRVAGFLKTAARDVLVPACDRYSAQLGRPYGKIALRDTRSRWGSCTSRGDLMFSWRLIMAPPPVLDYVAAHEVAHLAEMNHSSAFWDVTERLCPDYRRHRAWLKAHGGELQRWVFRD